ncbi:putative disease resistance protein RGA3 [Morella rubra]|uniref:Putative disease resistance protein RGA3 n=1 Tax=Morella rubra TaxID=262757 RepID=A0A6A1WJ87_9ROSI|nr:putative disease resistance protein RGA3 [Morella rubra]
MEETITLSSVAEGIIASLGSLPVKEIVQRWGVEDELERLKHTVSTIKSVLPDAEEQQDGNPEVRVWLEKLQNPMYDADDLLDDVSSEDLPEEDKKKKKVWNFFYKSNQGDKKKKKEWNVFSKSNQVPQHPFHIGRKIKDIREKLDVIAADRKFHLEGQRVKIGIENKKRGDTYSFVLEEDIIGREKDKKTVIANLLDSNVGENVSILPIVGIGGLGKTALAQLVFNDQEVQQHFELKMWVCVSDIFDIKILVKNIIDSTTRNKHEDVGMDALTQSLKNKIDSKKYLLVLDDVWNEDWEKWSRFKPLLMGGARGSRVLLTTRSEKVARISKTIEPYLLKGLDKQESWSLFKKMAFEEGKEPKDTRIVAIGREIVAKCVGVPLAIRTIGGLLYFKNPETEWLPFMTNELSRTPQNENDIIPTLKLSYDKLPSHLKQCFAYCSLFPKDYEFKKSTLIYLWMAQGFILVSNQHQELEDIGHDYFMDLLWRSFFQEVKVDESGDVIRCKMHDLMHDLATSVAGSLITPLNSIDEKTRHVSIHSFPVVTTLLSTSTRIRTLLLLCKGWGLTESTCDAIFSSFQFLRTLNLDDQELHFVPTFICKLKHLRYLDLSRNIIYKLPDSITSLQNLQTLRLSFCMSLEELPRDIKKLVNLRHLEIDNCYALKYMPRGLGELTNLQTLSNFMIPSSSVSKDCGDLSELNELNSLRGKLVIKIGRHGKDVALQCKAANLKEKKHLRALYLGWTYESDYFDSNTEDVLVEELEGLQPHPNLKSLSIWNYRGGIFPSWLLSLTNLVELWLKDCEKLQYLPPLSQLPSLKSISLEIAALEYISNSGDSNESVEMNTETLVMDPHLLLSFPRLSTLKIIDCPMLTSMPTFPSVEEELELSNVSFKLLQQTIMMNKVAKAQRSTPTAIASSSTRVASPTPLSKLKRLKLCGIRDLETLPEEWMRNLSSLKYLSIICCDAFDVCNDEDGMQWQGLKSLLSLEFDSLPKLVSLPLGLQHVSTLQKLFIYRCDNFMAIPEWIDNCTSLVHLEIKACPSLISLPEGMRGLTSLQWLHIYNCSPILFNRCKIETGVDWPKISHIPQLRIVLDRGVDWPNFSHIPQLRIPQSCIF